jgi:hypothetical protein
LIKHCSKSKLERQEATSKIENAERMNSSEIMVNEVISVTEGLGTTSEMRVTTPKIKQASFKQSSNKLKTSNLKRKRPAQHEPGKDKSRLDLSDFTEEGESRTFRRICRDMDFEKHESIMLDY